MPAKFFVNVVLPVTGPRQTGCLCISTIQGDSAEGDQNWYTKLLDLIHPDGKPFFSVYRFLLACDECIKAGKEASCEHKNHELPWWHDAAKQMLLRSIMDQLGYGDNAAQELQGVSKTKLKSVYSTPQIIKMFNENLTPPFDLDNIKEPPSHVFVTIDLSFGGKKSRTAVMSTVFYQGQIIIVAAEAIPAKIEGEYLPIVRRHILRLREIPCLKRAIVAVCVENNIQGPARQLCYDILSMGHEWIHFMTKVGADITSSDLFESVHNRQIGMRTQGRQGRGDAKEEMVLTLKDAIQQNLILFSKTFFITGVVQTSNDPEKDHRLAVDAYKKDLKEQLMAFSMKFQEVEGSFQVPKRTYDGKHRGPDDDAMALALNVYHGKTFRERPQ